MPDTSTTDLLALYETDKAAFVLAVADLREQQAKAVRSDLPWHVLSAYIRAEANPEHALAAVRHWRGVVERHERFRKGRGAHGWRCDPGQVWCLDLAEIADEARAYLAVSL